MASIAAEVEAVFDRRDTCKPSWKEHLGKHRYRLVVHYMESICAVQNIDTFRVPVQATSV